MAAVLALEIDYEERPVPATPELKVSIAERNHHDQWRELTFQLVSSGGSAQRVMLGVLQGRRCAKASL